MVSYKENNEDSDKKMCKSEKLECDCLAQKSYDGTRKF
jgi:hypothetical protein